MSHVEDTETPRLCALPSVSVYITGASILLRQSPPPLLLVMTTDIVTYDITNLTQRCQ